MSSSLVKGALICEISGVGYNMVETLQTWYFMAHG